MSIGLMLKGSKLQKSQKMVPHPDTYEVEIEPGQDNALIMAITTALDQMTHEK